MKKSKEDDLCLPEEFVMSAKAKAFHECVRILNDRWYKTERRVEACAAIAAFPLDELDRINSYFRRGTTETRLHICS